MDLDCMSKLYSLFRFKEKISVKIVLSKDRQLWRMFLHRYFSTYSIKLCKFENLSKWGTNSLYSRGIIIYVIHELKHTSHPPTIICFGLLVWDINLFSATTRHTADSIVAFSFFKKIHFFENWLLLLFDIFLGN